MANNSGKGTGFEYDVCQLLQNKIILLEDLFL